MKKNSLKQKALRLAAGGILSANLPESEFASLLDVLDARFAADLKIALTAFSMTEPQRVDPPSSHWPEESGNKSPIALLVYDGVRAKRMSRHRLLALMRDIAPLDVSKERADNASLLELIELFLEKASSSEARELLARVTGLETPLEDDPYLSGISKRREP